MIDLLAWAGRFCLSLTGLAVIGGAGWFAWLNSHDPLVTVIGVVAGIVVAGAILGPIANLYRMSDDLRAAKADLRMMNDRLKGGGWEESVPRLRRS